MVGFHGDLNMVESAKKSLKEQIQACNSVNFNHISKPWHLCKKKDLTTGGLYLKSKLKRSQGGASKRACNICKYSATYVVYNSIQWYSIVVDIYQTCTWLGKSENVNINIGWIPKTSSDCFESFAIIHSNVWYTQVYCNLIYTPKKLTWIPKMMGLGKGGSV